MLRSTLFLFLLWLAGAVALPAAAQAPADCTTLMTPGPQTGGPVARILSPVDGATIYGDSMTVVIEENPDFPFVDGNHWHLWANGTLQGMIYEQAARVELPPGTYHLCAVLGSEQHQDQGQPASITVELVGAAEGTPVSTPFVAGAAAPEPETGLNPVLLVGLALGAGIAGWAMGRVLGKRQR